MIHSLSQAHKKRLWSCSDKSNATKDGDTMFHPLCVALGNLPWELARLKGWYTVVALIPVFDSKTPAEEKRARLARCLERALRTLKLQGALWA